MSMPKKSLVQWDYETLKEQLRMRERSILPLALMYVNDDGAIDSTYLNHSFKLPTLPKISDKNKKNSLF